DRAAVLKRRALEADRRLPRVRRGERPFGRAATARRQDHEPGRNAEETPSHGREPPHEGSIACTCPTIAARRAPGRPGGRAEVGRGKAELLPTRLCLRSGLAVE